MKRCPALTFETDGPDADGFIAVRALMGKYEAGKITGVPADDGGFRVGYIRVQDHLRHCGIGTRLWTQLGKLACARGAPLQSDTIRTDAAEAFWRKQVAKGRADCMRSDAKRCLVYQLRCPVTSLDGHRKR